MTKVIKIVVVQDFSRASRTDIEMPILDNLACEATGSFVELHKPVVFGGLFPTIDGSGLKSASAKSTEQMYEHCPNLPAFSLNYVNFI